MEKSLFIDNQIKKRKDKLFNWFKDKNNLMLIIILLFAFAIRLYYFILTKSQPLWWDEACYGSLAKNFILHIWDNNPFILRETLIRPPLLAFLWSILIKLHIPETGARFILELLPSIFSVFFVYLIAKELYNKRVGLIASFLFSVLWIHLFYTARLLTNVPAMLFLFASFYLFIKSTKQEFIPKHFAISLFLLSLSTLMRYPNGIFFGVYFIMLFLEKKLLLKDKQFWIAGIIGIIPILTFFLYNYLTLGNIFPALFGGDYLNPVGSGGEPAPFAWHLLNFIPVFLKTPFFIFFIIGTSIILFEILIGYNFIFKNRKIKNNIFLVLILVFIFSFFIFYLKSAEDRYFLPASITMVCFSAVGFDFAWSFLKKFNKKIAFSIIIIILLFGAYSQLVFADRIIKNKQTSYLQIRQGFEWFGENTPSEKIVTGYGIDPYTIYYSERNFFNVPRNESDSEKISEADYLIYNSFMPQPEYFVEYIQTNPDLWEPINAWYFDQAKTQPAVIIFKKTFNKQTLKD